MPRSSLDGALYPDPEDTGRALIRQPDRFDLLYQAISGALWMGMEMLEPLVFHAGTYKPLGQQSGPAGLAAACRFQIIPGDRDIRPVTA